MCVCVFKMRSDRECASICFVLMSLFVVESAVQHVGALIHHHIAALQQNPLTTLMSVKAVCQAWWLYYACGLALSQPHDACLWYAAMLLALLCCAKSSQ